MVLGLTRLYVFFVSGGGWDDMAPSSTGANPARRRLADLISV